MSATYRLYYSPDSANLAVRMVLEDQGIAYRAERVDRAGGGLDEPSFRRAAHAEGIEGRLFIAPDYPLGDLRSVTG
jgi:hypothetical protein